MRRWRGSLLWCLVTDTKTLIWLRLRGCERPRTRSNTEIMMMALELERERRDRP